MYGEWRVYEIFFIFSFHLNLPSFISLLLTQTAFKNEWRKIKSWIESRTRPRELESWIINDCFFFAIALARTPQQREKSNNFLNIFSQHNILFHPPVREMHVVVVVGCFLWKARAFTSCSRQSRWFFHWDSDREKWLQVRLQHIYTTQCKNPSNCIRRHWERSLRQINGIDDGGRLTWSVESQAEQPKVPFITLRALFTLPIPNSELLIDIAPAWWAWEASKRWRSAVKSLPSRSCHTFFLFDSSVKFTIHV